MKTLELTGPALDWAVAKCEGKNGVLHDDGITRCIVIAAASGVYKGTWKPSINWSQGGPIIEREKIEIKYLGYDNPPYWAALKFSPSKYARRGAVGPTPLIAAMRCYVTSKLGDDVDVPVELL